MRVLSSSIEKSQVDDKDIGPANEKAQLDFIYDLKEVAKKNSANIQYARISGANNLVSKPPQDKRFPGVHAIQYEISVSVSDYQGMESLIGAIERHPFLITDVNIFYPGMTFKGALYGR